MEKKIMFVYEFEGRKKTEVNKINRCLFGYLDHSKHGRYIYRRDGELSKYSIDRITKGAFITDECNDKDVLKILHSKGTKKIRRFYLDVRKIVG